MSDIVSGYSDIVRYHPILSDNVWDSRGNHERYVKIVISTALQWQNRGVWADPPFYGGKTEGFGHFLRIRWVLPFKRGPKNPDCQILSDIATLVLTARLFAEQQSA